MLNLDPTVAERADAAGSDAVLPEEGAMVELHHLQGKAPCLILCDHAGRRIPKRFGNLGLSEQELSRHIGWDIGAADVTRHLALLLDAPAVLCHASRLLVDPNRRPGDPTSMPERSDGTFVPGNRDLDRSEVGRRLRDHFVPYHRAIARQIARLRRRIGIPAIVSIHSFTPVMKRGWRPWEIAVLWDEDDRMAGPVLEGLRRDASLRVGDNEPYSGRYPIGYTIPFHARRPGLPHVTFELRQDLIDTESRGRGWAERLALVLRAPLRDPDLYRFWKR